METGLYWVITLVLLAAVLWFIFRPKGAGSAALAEALGRKPMILDVRTQGEFAQGHVAGAKNVPVGTLGGVAPGLCDKDRTLVLYCRSGARSAQAARILRAAGYTDVTDGGAMSTVSAAHRALEAQ